MSTVNLTAREGFTGLHRTQVPVFPGGRDIQVARLVEEARQAAILQERRRLAREIHDTVAQTLAALLLQIRAADQTPDAECGEMREHLARMSELTQEGLADVRRTLQALRPRTLEANDLSSALRRIANHVAEETGLDVRFQESGNRYALAPEAEDELLRIAQEAVANVIKHAKARRVRIALRYGATQVVLSVQDDGRGFDLTAAKQGRFGLIGMRERADRLGAALTIESAPKRGTRVTATLRSGRTLGQ